MRCDETLESWPRGQGMPTVRVVILILILVVAATIRTRAAAVTRAWISDPWGRAGGVWWSSFATPAEVRVRAQLCRAPAPAPFFCTRTHTCTHPRPRAVDSAVSPDPDAVARVVARAAARKAAFQDKKGRKGARGAASDTPDPAAFWQCPLPETSIVVVDDVPGLLACWAVVTGTALQVPGYPGSQEPSPPSLMDSQLGDGAAKGDVSDDEARDDRQSRAREAQSTSAPARVCGVDAEWDPDGPSLPRTPVSLLQLSTRDRCFVLDLLALCRSPHARITDQASRLAASHGQHPRLAALLAPTTAQSYDGS